MSYTVEILRRAERVLRGATDRKLYRRLFLTLFFRSPVSGFRFTVSWPLAPAASPLRPALDTPLGCFHLSWTMQALAEQDEVAFADFPELHKLCWNEHARTIPAADAYRLYVRNWDFVRRGTLAIHESALLKSLNARFGRLLDV